MHSFKTYAALFIGESPGMLKHLQCLNKLKQLSLSFWELTLEDMSLLVSSFPNLVDLTLVSSSLTDQGVDLLKGLFHLRHLNVESNDLTPKAFQNLSLDNFQTLKIAWSTCALTLIPRLNHIVSLSITTSDDDHKLATKILAEISQCHTLEELKIELRTEISSPDDDFDVSFRIEQLASLPSLRILDLSDSSLADRQFQNIWKLEHLERLYLNRTYIGDTALKHISRLPRLTYVSVLGCDYVTVTGVAYLLSKNPTTLQVVHYFDHLPTFYKAKRQL